MTATGPQDGDSTPVGHPRVTLIVHGGDLWLWDGAAVVGLVRFRRPLSGDILDKVRAAVDQDGDWVAAVRRHWLVGQRYDVHGDRVEGLYGGRVACVRCSKALVHWDPGRLLGVECVQLAEDLPGSADLEARSLLRWPEAADPDPAAPSPEGSVAAVPRPGPRQLDPLELPPFEGVVWRHNRPWDSETNELLDASDPRIVKRAAAVIALGRWLEG